MRTKLDSLHELELQSIKYDGRTLVAEVAELVVGYGGRVGMGATRYFISFVEPVAHALTEEFPSVCARWIQGDDIGFLRRIENASLQATMGLDLQQFQSHVGYALITAHEILVVYCNQEPVVFELNDQ